MANKVKNRLEALGQTTSDGKAGEATLKVLIEMMDANNCLVKVFRRVAGLIVGDMSDTICERDIVVQFQSTNLKEIRDDHPLYMSLQYPLLFPYGEYGFNTEIPLHLKEGSSKTRKFLSIR
ncbi:unnamed protein product [Brassica oleracea var. botrytis]|uniref:(rape) hypothetical protein n=1 Tax=Brassica napus TaxID=3708 RepID=A0A816JC55_BRANA|nr:unnamed protein product [Brassica napus]